MRCGSMWRFLLLLFLLLGLCLVAVADDCIPYCDIGNIVPQPSSNVVAANSGDVLAYFFGHEAHNASMIRMWDMTTGAQSPWVFNNLTTRVGTQANLGHVNKGDLLVFEIWDALQNNTQPGAGFIYYSLPQLNPDHLNHFYVAPWAGGNVSGAFIPAGTFMGGEDLPYPYTDWDYNDNEFVWNISSSDFGADYQEVPTPEPGSLQLLLLAGLGAAPALKRRFHL